MEPTLHSLITTAVDRFTDQPAITTPEQTWTYRQITEQANRLAHNLISLGVQPGEPVALMLDNSAEWVIADQAIIRAGAAKVPINDMLTTGEVDYILRDCGARVAITNGHFTAQAHAATISNVIELAPGSMTEAAESTESQRPHVVVTPHDTALILYTGGTTGRQKGVVHTQRGLAANLLAHQIELGFQDDERLLLTAPLAHSAGFLLQAGLSKGARIHLDRKFNAYDVLHRIETASITFLFLVPTMVYRLLDVAETQESQVSSLRTILYGAAPITPERLKQGIARFGPVFMQLYGQSEAPNFLTRLTREDHENADPGRLTSCGRPAAMVRIAVLDGNGHPAEPGTVGEICAQAPYLMEGYLGLSDKTAETLADGWLHTGDIGNVDADGYVYLLDRKNDMVITGGMNVYTTEVEQVIGACAGVSQVAVVGVPHPDWGEAVTAFIVPTSDYREATVRDACRRHLAAYKRPKSIVEVETLPATALGKVDKKSLRHQST
ncbi:AMP-binding protein [Mycobacterium sp. 4858]|uniref:AMP-binding protein n=1 Tax=Mycobacterium sp. 4858 TaxID=2057185 RepID=UPI000C825F85|nr:AMP-binding protein [Mycobacterium sp. 4858]